MLGDFIEAEFPADENLSNATVVAQTAERFFQLLTSAPMLFAYLSLAVNATSNQFMIPPSFRNPQNMAASSALAVLSADFVALANDSCGLALSTDQIRNANMLFASVLPTFVILSQECNLLNVAIMEQAVESADVGLPNTVSFLLVEIGNTVGIGGLLLITNFNGQISIIRISTPDDVVPAAAQALLNDFLFFINDFCGIPPLSNATLMLLDQYFLVDLVDFATGPGPV